jgi:hypothetical protein
MLRILIWRFCFEWLSFLKLCGFKGKHSFYFAFGGNLDPAVLERRRISVFSTEFVYLPNHEINFNHEIPFEGVGFASIEFKESAEVPGVLLEIGRIDEWRMDCFEACLIFGRYRKGRTHIGHKSIFYYFTGRPLSGLKPTTEYLNKILTGYRTFLRDDSPFLKGLAARDTIPKMVPKRPPRFLITDYDRFGPAARPLLEWYDTKCTQLFVFFIFRPSIFQRWLPFSYPTGAV